VRGGGFWTNHVANPVLRPLLRSPLGRLMGRRLAVLRYTGVRTGRPHALVCGYARTARTVWVLVGDAENKVWWRNLRAPADVDLWLAGRRVRARAVAVVGAEQPREARDGLRVYVEQLPDAAGPLHLPDGRDPSAIAAAAKRTVLVRADLTQKDDAVG
jgi:hypothetical protein